MCVCYIEEREKYAIGSLYGVCLEREKYGLRLAFTATPGHGGPSVAALTVLKRGDTSAVGIRVLDQEREL